MSIRQFVIPLTLLNKVLRYVADSSSPFNSGEVIQMADELRGLQETNSSEESSLDLGQIAREVIAEENAKLVEAEVVNP
jgi:hypothetical protein